MAKKIMVERETYEKNDKMYFSYFIREKPISDNITEP